MSNSMPFSLVLLAAASLVSAQTYTVIHNFGSQPGDPESPETLATIAQSRGGALYSTAWNPDGSGAAFRIWPGGDVQVVHHFAGQQWSGLTLATDGQYYGTTVSGGALSHGTVFKMTQGGTLTTLYEFQGGSDGQKPEAAPIQSVEGEFYGTTAGAYPANRYGSLYRITKDGNFTLLHTFAHSDGAYPSDPLVQGTDFSFYGVAYTGGANNQGVIYRLSSSGNFKVLVNFNFSNGAQPMGPLVQANDGNLYGVTYTGGPSSNGVLFRMTPGGQLTVLHYFTGGSDGGYPSTGLVLGSDGNLYGVTGAGGQGGYGVLFRATLSGDVVPLHKFTTYDRGGYTRLLQHTNGKFYGSTVPGKLGEGAFYSFDAGLTPFVKYLPTYGRVGALLQILGQGFTTGSKVSFNGTPATSPVIVYPTYLRVEVPPGATTGPITVTTTNGTLTSSKVFVVHPN